MVIEQCLLTRVILWCAIESNPDGTHEIEVSDEAGSSTLSGHIASITTDAICDIGKQLRTFLNDRKAYMSNAVKHVRETVDRVTGQVYIAVGDIGFFTMREAMLLLRVIEKQFQLA